MEDREIISGFNEGISFKDIALNHFKRIGKLASVEFKGGYWEEKILVVNGVAAKQKVYVPDTSEIYSNAVEYLHDILLPHFDKKMEATSKEHDTKIEEAHKTHTEEVEGKDCREFSGEKERKRYRSKRVKIVRGLFQELARFLRRQKYFDLEGYEDLGEKKT